MSTFSTTNNGYTLALEVTETSTSVENNTSLVSYALTLTSNASNKYFEQYAIGYSVSLNGAVVNSQPRSAGIQYNIAKYGTITFCSGTATIPHNSDGSKTMALAFSIDMASVSYTPGPMSYSGSMALSTIPRKSSVSASDAKIGAASTITITSYSNAFTHTLRYKAAGQSSYTTIISKTSLRSYPWTLTQAQQNTLYALIPNNPSITVEVQCETFNGSTSLGTNSCSVTLSVDPDVCKPTISSVTLYDSNSKTVALTGSNQTLVSGQSNLYYSITASANCGASLSSSSYRVSCGGKTATASSGTIIGVTSGTINITVTDSRGVPTEWPATRTLIPYSPPSISANVQRQSPTSGTLQATFSGNRWQGSFGYVTNAIAVKYRWREVGGTYGDWTIVPSASVLVTGNTYSSNGTITLGTGFSYTKAYDVQFMIADSLYDGSESAYTKTTTINVTRGTPVFDWGENDFNFNVQVKAGSGMITSGNIYPSANNSYYLGTSTNKFNTVYANTGFFTSMAINGYSPWTSSTLPVSSGTWTPSGTGISSASGSYYRIGNLVTVWGKCTVTSSTSTNALAISGLPYTCNSNTDSVAGTIGRTSNMVVYTSSNKAAKTTTYFPVVSAGGSTVYFVEFFGGRSWGNISYSVVNSGNVNFFLTYFI